MSSTTVRTIMCDAPGCGTWWDAGVVVEEPAAVARRRLRGLGWQVGVRDDRSSRLAGRWPAQDYCPQHRQQPPAGKYTDS